MATAQRGLRAALVGGLVAGGLALASAGPASAQQKQTNITYECKGRNQGTQDYIDQANDGIPNSTFQLSVTTTVSGNDETGPGDEETIFHTWSLGLTGDQTALLEAKKVQSLKIYNVHVSLAPNEASPASGVLEGADPGPQVFPIKGHGGEPIQYNLPELIGEIQVEDDAENGQEIVLVPGVIDVDAYFEAPLNFDQTWQLTCEASPKTLFKMEVVAEEPEEPEQPWIPPDGPDDVGCDIDPEDEDCIGQGHDGPDDVAGCDDPEDDGCPTPDPLDGPDDLAGCADPEKDGCEDGNPDDGDGGDGGDGGIEGGTGDGVGGGGVAKPAKPAKPVAGKASYAG